MWVVSRYQPYNSDASQVREAVCPRGDQILGGGARIRTGGDQVRLTMLRPYHDTTIIEPVPDRFIARAEEPDTGYAGTWRLETYAICGAVRGYEIVGEDTDESSSVFQITAATCPGQKRVIGTGAEIRHANGQVGLQLVRPDGALGIARATGREDADRYAQNWSIEAFAICADRIESAAVYGTLGDQGGTANCPPDKFVHSVGGGGSLVDSGPYFLQAVYPNANLRTFTVAMTGPPVGGTAVGAVCAF